MGTTQCSANLQIDGRRDADARCDGHLIRTAYEHATRPPGPTNDCRANLDLRVYRAVDAPSDRYQRRTAYENATRPPDATMECSANLETDGFRVHRVYSDVDPPSDGYQLRTVYENLTRPPDPTPHECITDMWNYMTGPQSTPCYDNSGYVVDCLHLREKQQRRSDGKQRRQCAVTGRLGQWYRTDRPPGFFYVRNAGTYSGG